MILTSRIHRGIHKSNNTITIENVGHPLCHAWLRIMDAIVRCRGLEPIRNQGERHTTEILRPGFVTGNVIDTNTKDFAAFGMHLVTYRRKDGHFIRSTSGEITREEENNDLLSPQAAQRYIFAGVRGKVKSGACAPTSIAICYDPPTMSGLLVHVDQLIGSDSFTRLLYRLTQASLKCSGCCPITKLSEEHSQPNARAYLG